MNLQSTGKAIQKPILNVSTVPDIELLCSRFLGETGRILEGERFFGSMNVVIASEEEKRFSFNPLNIEVSTHVGGICHLLVKATTNEGIAALYDAIDTLNRPADSNIKPPAGLGRRRKKNLFSTWTVHQGDAWILCRNPKQIPAQLAILASQFGIDLKVDVDKPLINSNFSSAIVVFGEGVKDQSKVSKPVWPLPLQDFSDATTASDILMKRVVPTFGNSELLKRLGIPKISTCLLDVTYADGAPPYLESLASRLGLTVKTLRVSDFASSNIGGQEEKLKSFFSRLPKNTLLVVPMIDRIFPASASGNIGASNLSVIQVLDEQLRDFGKNGGLFIGYTQRPDKVHADANSLFQLTIQEGRQSLEQTKELWKIAIEQQEHKAGVGTDFAFPRLFAVDEPERDQDFAQELVDRSGVVSFHKMVSAIQTALTSYMQDIQDGKIPERNLLSDVILNEKLLEEAARLKDSH